MSTKSIHIGRPEPHWPRNHVPWSTRMRVMLVTLVLLGSGYTLWHILRAEPPIPIPDTPILPVPAP
jgi:hypothetical protein